MKSSLELMKEVRKEWLINPVTRVHDNDPGKNIKKARSEARKAVKKALSEESRELFSYLRTACKTYTSGCTAVSEADLLNVPKWLKPDTKPVIIQSTIKELKQLRPLPVQ